MKFSIISLQPLISFALAIPSLQHGSHHGSHHGSLHSRAKSRPSTSSFPAWKGAGPNDVRSPCPMLNTLCNHGLLPHNGRQITIDNLQTAFAAMNLGQDLATSLGSVAISLSSNPAGSWFDLTDLDTHGAIEHDGSLSRMDYSQGNNHDFNPWVWAQVAQSFTAETIDIPTAAKALSARQTMAQKTNPAYNLTAAGVGISLGETAFYISVFGDPYTGIAQRSWVNTFFRLERLPIAEGWTPRTQETNFTTLNAMVKKVVAATPNQKAVPLNVGHLSGKSWKSW